MGIGIGVWTKIFFLMTTASTDSRNAAPWPSCVRTGLVWRSTSFLNLLSFGIWGLRYTEILGIATNFFTQAFGFFEMGTSLGFYSKLSQRPKETAMIRFYWGYSLGVGGLVLSLTVAAIGAGWGPCLWPEQASRHILAAFGLCFFLSLLQILNYMMDGFGSYGGKSRNSQRIFGLVVLVLLGWVGFSLDHFILYNILLAAFLAVLWICDLRRHGHVVVPKERLTSGEQRQYVVEFYRYGSPLAIYSLIGWFINVWDRWLLQKYAGAVQQGFYGFAFQLAGVAFLLSLHFVHPPHPRIIHGPRCARHPSHGRFV